MCALSSSRSFEMPAASLEKVLSRSLQKVPRGEGPLLVWPLACGSAVAGRTRALAYADGILRVEVPDAGWKRELQALAPQYLAVINRYISEPVNRIEFALPAKR